MKDKAASGAFVPEMDRANRPDPMDFESFDTIVERRIKDLLVQGLSPKEMTEAIKAATEWRKATREAGDGGSWGANLGKGTTTNG